MSKYQRLGVSIYGAVVPDYLKKVTQERHPDLMINPSKFLSVALFINSRWIVDSRLFSMLEEVSPSKSFVWTCKDQVVAALVQPQDMQHVLSLMNEGVSHADLYRYFTQACSVISLANEKMIVNVWDLMRLHLPQLTEELTTAPSLQKLGTIKGTVGPFASIVNESQVYISDGAVVEDFALLNAQKGPIYLSKGVVVESGTRLEGPLYVGPNTRLMGGKISSSSIGPWCKIAGEVSESVFMGYSNKGHYGYVGNSYVGQWVNFGAGTTTSNLKNTYGPVSLTINGEKVDTGLQFLGSLIGDHTKFGIGTLLNTGSLIGLGCNIFGPGFQETCISDFSWGQSGSFSKYHIQKWLGTAKTVMARRQTELSPLEETMITQYYNSL